MEYNYYLREPISNIVSKIRLYLPLHVTLTNLNPIVYFNKTLMMFIGRAKLLSTLKQIRNFLFRAAFELFTQPYERNIFSIHLQALIIQNMFVL